jgi:hypothetical protein
MASELELEQSVSDACFSTAGMSVHFVSFSARSNAKISTVVV